MGDRFRDSFSSSIEEKEENKQVILNETANLLKELTNTKSFQERKTKIVKNINLLFNF